MKLLTHRSSEEECTYYLDEGGLIVYHGEYKDYHDNWRLRLHVFYYHGIPHGEYLRLDNKGTIGQHSLVINGRFHPYVEMTAQEKLLFQIEHPNFRFIE